MPDITLGSGTLVDDRVVLVDGELERIYQPVLFTKSVKAAVVRKLEALDKVAEQAMRRLRIDKSTIPPGEEVLIDWSEAEWARRLRVMCDTITLLVSSDNAEAPKAGDLLYEGWDGDRIAEFQIIQLYHTFIPRNEGKSDPS